MLGGCGVPLGFGLRHAHPASVRADGRLAAPTTRKQNSRRGAAQVPLSVRSGQALLWAHDQPAPARKGTLKTKTPEP